MRNLKESKQIVSSYDIELYDEVMELLYEMDFEKILLVMEMLEWTYFHHDEITIDVLQNLASEVLFGAIAELIVHNYNNNKTKINSMAITTGGFKGYSYINEEDKLQFELQFCIESLSSE